MTVTPVSEPAPGRRRLILLAPLVVFLGLAGLFLARLGAGDVSRLPSVLINKPAPSFSLPGLDGVAPALTDGTLREGHVTLVNVFASWCVPCRDEHAVLMKLARDPVLQAGGLRVAGIAYKDAPEQSRAFLKDNGNPYAAIAVDEKGRAGIDWGVYGVPETFLVRGDGTIATKFIGPLSDQSLATDVMPALLAAMR